MTDKSTRINAADFAYTTSDKGIVVYASIPGVTRISSVADLRRSSLQNGLHLEGMKIEDLPPIALSSLPS